MENQNQPTTQDNDSELALLEQAGWFRDGETRAETPEQPLSDTRTLPKVEADKNETAPQKSRFSLDPRRWGSRTQAVASLGLCLLSSIYGFLFLIPAVYLAHKSRKASKAAPGIDGASALSMFALIVSYFLAFLALQNLVGSLLFLGSGLS